MDHGLLLRDGEIRVLFEWLADDLRLGRLHCQGDVVQAVVDHAR